MKTTARQLATALSLFTLGIAASAQPPDGGEPRPEPGHFRGPGRPFGLGGPGGHGARLDGPPLGMLPRLGMLKERLGLTEDQVSQMKVLHEKQRESMKPIAEKAKAAGRAFQAALEVESPDPVAVGQAAIAMRAARREMQAAREAGFEQLKGLLTAEQAAKLKEFEDRRAEGAKKMRGGPGGGLIGPRGRGMGHRPRGGTGL